MDRSAQDLWCNLSSCCRPVFESMLSVYGSATVDIPLVTYGCGFGVPPITQFLWSIMTAIISLLAMSFHKYLPMSV